MVVFHVSTFILQLHTFVSVYFYFTGAAAYAAAVNYFLRKDLQSVH